MIRDRGAIKWTSMMLPEHVKLLRDWAKEDLDQQKPDLDEQQLEAMNSLLFEAMEAGKQLVITYYENRRHKLLIGKMHHYDEFNQKLHLVDKFGEPHYIGASQLVDLRLNN
ncbi:YolD-like family protein [Litchfieldia salsa]|uniref:YolD-like protein n=1 Tax=Litchfieldia salsa TaxID=930152 RepID=A0A1H0WH87_9BACI|nr:YolD-like family protein [Litchfieldia salsa]SDP90094.1 YolD-like protein [Litchfieldia salsa]